MDRQCRHLKPECLRLNVIRERTVVICALIPDRYTLMHTRLHVHKITVHAIKLEHLKKHALRLTALQDIVSVTINPIFLLN